jgi:hypothetical protein
MTSGGCGVAGGFSVTGGGVAGVVGVTVVGGNSAGRFVGDGQLPPGHVDFGWTGKQMPPGHGNGGSTYGGGQMPCGQRGGT